jgi:hydroxymethylglutaryl-CoA synthase
LYCIFHAKLGKRHAGLMRGVIGWGTHLPYRRLDRSEIRAVAGSGGGTGTRTVASYDEDTTTMGAEAARAALRVPGAPGPESLWFATTEPAYADRTNATAIHAVLRLDRNVPAYDVTGSVRSAMAALRAAWQGTGTALAVASDTRTGLPGGPDEAAGGDAAAALLIGDGPVITATSGTAAAPVLAEITAWESVTEEFLDRWRAPGARNSKLWEERFGESHYSELGADALKRALAKAAIAPGDVDCLITAGSSERAASSVMRKSGVPETSRADRLTATVGNPGAAQPALLLAAALEQATRNQHIVLLTLADGADAVVLKTTEAIETYRPYHALAQQLAAGAPVSYGRYLHWRGMLPVEPPRRPEPARVSSPAAHRNAAYKFGFPLADASGTIVTFTIDRLAYSLSPPVVFAIVDFDGGGRLPVELTDTDADEVAIGGRVEMTFRRLATSDGIHNYFWKARPARDKKHPNAREAG